MQQERRNHVNEVFVFYQDLKIWCASNPRQEYHPFHSSGILQNKWIITIENQLTGNSNYFYYWTNKLEQKDLVDFFYYTLKESGDVTTWSYQDYINEFEEGEDSGRNRDMYAYMTEQAEKIKQLDPEFDFEECWGMDDSHIFDNRITFRQEVREAPHDYIMVWDDQWIEATYSNEPVAHPGGDSMHSYSECWVDVENRYPMDEPVFWTFPWAEITAQSSSDAYNIKQPTVQLINPSPSEDDDYYATL